jgi:hypothetical protein
MIENLSVELSRVVAVYKNRSRLFEWDGKRPAFDIKEVVRHHLFMKVEGAGFTPVPNVRVLKWTVDLVCLRGLRPELMFVVRENKKDDYRQLLIFPKEIRKIVVALSDSAAKSIEPEIEVWSITKRPTELIRQNTSITTIIKDYIEVFEEVYGFKPGYSKAQLTSPAARLTSFWQASGKGLSFREYCKWVMLNKTGERGGDLEKVTNLQDLINRTHLDTFKRNQAGRTYDETWTTEGGWDALDT